MIKAAKLLFILCLLSILNAKAQQIKYPESFKLNTSVFPGYKIFKDEGAKATETENVTDKKLDSLYSQRFESADKKNMLEVHVYELKSEQMFKDKVVMERLQLMQGYLQMFDVGKFEFMKVKNYLIQLQSITPRATNRAMDKIRVDKLSNYYKSKLGATVFKIPALQKPVIKSLSTNTISNQPNYTKFRIWVSRNFNEDFYKKYIDYLTVKQINVKLYFDEQGKTTVKEIIGTNNEKLTQAIKDMIAKMPIWTKDEVGYSSTINLPLRFVSVE